MPKVILHSTYVTVVPIDKDVRLELDQQVEVFRDRYPKKAREPGTIRILHLCEPPVIKSPRKKLPRHAHEFDHILTYDPWVLKRYPQAQKFVYGTTFVDKAPDNREFSISTVVGTKLISKGHHLRQKFLKKAGKIRNPFRWFFSNQYEEDNIPIPAGGLKLGDDKSAVFRSQFHVAIENCRMPDYFTEKVMDCFMTKTVPIYWGCTNVADYFNPGGIITCKSLGALVKACNNITPDTYSRMQAAIDENYERAQKYVNLADRLADKIRELVGEQQVASKCSPNGEKAFSG